MSKRPNATPADEYSNQATNKQAGPTLIELVSQYLKDQDIEDYENGKLLGLDDYTLKLSKSNLSPEFKRFFYIRHKSMLFDRRGSHAPCHQQEQDDLGNLWRDHVKKVILYYGETGSYSTASAR